MLSSFASLKHALCNVSHCSWATIKQRKNGRFPSWRLKRWRASSGPDEGQGHCFILGCGLSLEPQAGGTRPQRAQGKRSERQSVRRLFPDTKTLSRLRPSQLQPRPEVASSQGQPWTMCTDGKIGAMSDHHESQPPLPAAILRITLPLRGKHLNLGQDKPQELQLALTPCPASPACLMLQPLKKRCRCVKNSH